MGKNLEKPSKIQRRCILDYENKGCINCDIDVCPYIYCHQLECLSCTLRLTCPMCKGECTECRYNTICMMSRKVENK